MLLFFQHIDFDFSVLYSTYEQSQELLMKKFQFVNQYPQNKSFFSYNTFHSYNKINIQKRHYKQEHFKFSPFVHNNPFVLAIEQKIRMITTRSNTLNVSSRLSFIWLPSILVQKYQQQVQLFLQLPLPSPKF